MSDLVPGTPEYQEAYDKEMQRLEAEAGGTDKKPEPEATITPEAKIDEPKTETAEQLANRLASTEKALKDTQRAFHENAALVKQLKREADERKRAETRPAILDANPGLEDAIKHVAEPATPAPVRWQQSIAHAIPDIEQLLNEPAFFQAAQARKNALGADWDDPLTAIRELSSLKVEHVSAKQQDAIRETVRRDFEQKANKRNAMSVPGGGAGRDTPQQVDEAQKVWAMSDKDFHAQRAKVMGY